MVDTAVLGISRFQDGVHVGLEGGRIVNTDVDAMGYLDDGVARLGLARVEGLEETLHSLFGFRSAG